MTKSLSENVQLKIHEIERIHTATAKTVFLVKSVGSASLKTATLSFIRRLTQIENS